MARDNVTPFRPRPKPPKPKSSGGLNLKSHRGKAVLVQALTLAAFVLSFVFPAPPLSYLVLAVAIGAMAVAVSSRRESMPWANTHHEHALRTLLFGYSINVLSMLILPMLAPLWSGVMMVLFAIQVVVLIWAGIRAGVGVVLAIMRRPIWHPTGVLL